MNEVIYIQPTDPIDRMREACSFLGKWIDSLPNPKNFRRLDSEWQFVRSYEIDHYGEKSVVSLFPEKLDKGQKQIVFLVNLLGSCGYHTKRDLIPVTREHLKKIRGFSGKNIELTLALVEIATAESDLAKTKTTR